jgi:hypothetical protein
MMIIITKGCPGCEKCADAAMHNKSHGAFSARENKHAKPVASIIADVWLWIASLSFGFLAGLTVGRFFGRWHIIQPSVRNRNSADDF